MIAIFTCGANGSSAARPIKMAGTTTKVLISSMMLSCECAFSGGPIDARATPRPCPREAVTTKMSPNDTITTSS